MSDDYEYICEQCLSGFDTDYPHNEPEECPECGSDEILTMTEHEKNERLNK